MYENIFSGFVRTDGDGNTYCLIHDKVRLVVRTDKTGYMKISVNPKMIKMFPAQGVPSGDHGFVGRVIQLTDEGGDVRVLVDIGIPISVLLGKKEYKQAPILTGERVALVCPPESIEVM